MCEFSVYDVENPSKRIAEDIVTATLRNGNLIIRKVLGEAMELEDSTILEVDVPKERMIICHFSPLAKIARMADLLSNYRKNPSPRLYEEIQALWKQAKADGDHAMGSMKGRP